jgi:hypothetical protein
LKYDHDIKKKNSFNELNLKEENNGYSFKNFKDVVDLKKNTNNLSSNTNWNYIRKDTSDRETFSKPKYENSILNEKVNKESDIPTTIESKLYKLKKSKTNGTHSNESNIENHTNEIKNNTNNLFLKSSYTDKQNNEDNDNKVNCKNPTIFKNNLIDDLNLNSATTLNNQQNKNSLNKSNNQNSSSFLRHTKTRKRRRDMTTLGLKEIAFKVKHIVKMSQITKYKEIADKLVNNVDVRSFQDSKNIRRRIYDALNVLKALGMFTNQNENPKSIFWNKDMNKSEINNDLAIQIKNKESEIKNKQAKRDSIIFQIKMFQDIIEFNKKKESTEVNIKSDKELVKIQNEKQINIYTDNIDKNNKIFPPFFTIHYINKFTTAKIIYSETSKKRIHISNGTPLGFIGDFDIFKRLYQINFNNNINDVQDQTEDFNYLNNNGKMLPIESSKDDKEEFDYKL